MRKVHRTALALLLVPGLLGAQEPQEEPSEQAVEIRMGTDADELRARVASLVEELLAEGDPAARETLERRLADLVLRELARGRIVDEHGRSVPDAVAVTMRPDRGGETIKGSWADGERRGSWKLSKIEGDRYALEARVTTGDGGGEQTVTDEGTLAELTRKHPFLDGTAVVGFLDGMTRFQDGVPASVTRSRPARVDTVPLTGLGLELAEAGDDLRHQFWLPVGVGWVVRSVTPDSPAARSGLQPYDLVTKVGGAWLERPEALRSADARAVPLTVLRRGHEIRLDLAQAD